MNYTAELLLQQLFGRIDVDWLKNQQTKKKKSKTK